MPHSFSLAVSMNLEHSIKEESHERYPVHLQCLGNIKKIKYPDFQAMTLISVMMFLSCSYTLWGPGTSAGEQIKAVSCGISGNVSCLWGTQFHGLARCSLIWTSLASSKLYVSSTGCSAKVITVSLPMYR